jgi:formylglycine-generating enzyme required for sulfatase activity
MKSIGLYALLMLSCTVETQYNCMEEECLMLFEKDKDIPEMPDMQVIDYSGGFILIQGGNDVYLEYRDTVIPIEKSFLISKAEVTKEEFNRCISAKACKELTPAQTTNTPAHFPIRGIPWVEARKYAKWIGGDLPTQAQWEYAAKSRGLDRIYVWEGENPRAEDCPIYAPPAVDNSEYCIDVRPYTDYYTLTGCSMPMDITEQGVCDMQGNLSEWVLDDEIRYQDISPELQAETGAFCYKHDCSPEANTSKLIKGDSNIPGISQKGLNSVKYSFGGVYGTIDLEWVGFRVVKQVH